MWNKHQTSVVDFIRNTLGLGERFSSEEVTFQHGISARIAYFYQVLKSNM